MGTLSDFSNLRQKKLDKVKSLYIFKYYFLYNLEMGNGLLKVGKKKANNLLALSHR